MSNTSVIDKNKLIVEFMGYSPMLNGSYNVECLHDGIGFHLETMKYNWSWDWLIPVIKKILLMDHIDMSSWRMITNPLAYDIERVFNQVVEFIEWFNEEYK